jgi:ferredoxin
MTTKIKVDFDLCESNAMCVAMAPEEFRIDDDDYLQVDDPIVTAANRDRVERAIAACPKSALSLIEE